MGFDKQAMDNAATEAENDLIDVSDENLKQIGNWINKWYMKAGYKRLGRILKQFADTK